MNELELAVTCPYCSEEITILADPSQVDQTYTEDCSVCCRPIVFHVRFDEQGELQSVDADRA